MKPMSYKLSSIIRLLDTSKEYALLKHFNIVIKDDGTVITVSSSDIGRYLNHIEDKLKDAASRLAVETIIEEEYSKYIPKTVANSIDEL